MRRLGPSRGGRTEAAPPAAGRSFGGIALASGRRRREETHSLTALKPTALLDIDESRALMDVLQFEAGGQVYGLPADEVDRVLALGDARRHLGSERMTDVVDLDSLLDPDGTGGAQTPRVIIGRGEAVVALVRGRVSLQRVYRSQLLPIPAILADQAADRGIVGMAVSERSALFLLVSLLPFGGLAVPL